MEKVILICLFLILTIFSYPQEENLIIIKVVEDNINDLIEERIFLIEESQFYIQDEKDFEFIEKSIDYKKLPFVFKQKDLEKSIIEEFFLDNEKKNKIKSNKDFYYYDNKNISNNISNNINGTLENYLFLNDYNILNHSFKIFNKNFLNHSKISITKDGYIINNKIEITYFKKLLLSNIFNFNYEEEDKYTGIALLFEENLDLHLFTQDFFINYIIDKNWFNCGLRLNFNIFRIFNITPYFIYTDYFYSSLNFGFDYKGFILNIDNFIITDFNNTKYSFNLYFSYTNDFLSIRVFKFNKNFLEWKKSYYNNIFEERFILYSNEIDKEKSMIIESISGFEFVFLYKIFYLTINSIFFFDNPFLDINFNKENRIDFFNNYSSLKISFDFNRFFFETKIYLYFFKNTSFKYGIDLYFNDIIITKYFNISSGIIFYIDKNNKEFTILPDITFSFIPKNNSKLYFRATIGLQIEESNINFRYILENGIKVNF